MPNQDQQNQNNPANPAIDAADIPTTGASVAQPISTEPIADFPPPPMVVSEAMANSPTTGTDQSLPPLNVSPVVVTGGSGEGLGKKMGRKGFVATILGVLLLVGGVGAGLYLTGQDQDVREKAAIPEDVCNDDSVTECVGKNQSDSCISGGITGTCQFSSTTTQTCKCTTPLPPTSSIDYRCKEIRTYKITGDKSTPANWSLLTTSQLRTLQAGDVVYFTVLGTSTETATANGGFDKAEFTINGGAPVESTNIKPRLSTDAAGNVEFYYQYTVPTNKFDYNIKARIHHLTAGWM